MKKICSLGLMLAALFMLRLSVVKASEMEAGGSVGLLLIRQLVDKAAAAANPEAVQEAVVDLGKAVVNSPEFVTEAMTVVAEKVPEVLPGVTEVIVTNSPELAPAVVAAVQEAAPEATAEVTQAAVKAGGWGLRNAGRAIYSGAGHYASRGLGYLRSAPSAIYGGASPYVSRGAGYLRSAPSAIYGGAKATPGAIYRAPGAMYGFAKENPKTAAAIAAGAVAGGYLGYKGYRYVKGRRVRAASDRERAMTVVTGKRKLIGEIESALAQTENKNIKSDLDVLGFKVADIFDISEKLVGQAKNDPSRVINRPPVDMLSNNNVKISVGYNVYKAKQELKISNIVLSNESAGKRHSINVRGMAGATVKLDFERIFAQARLTDSTITTADVQNDAIAALTIFIIGEITGKDRDIANILDLTPTETSTAIKMPMPAPEKKQGWFRWPFGRSKKAEQQQKEEPMLAKPVGAAESSEGWPVYSQ